MTLRLLLDIHFTNPQYPVLLIIHPRGNFHLGESLCRLKGGVGFSLVLKLDTTEQ